MPRATLWVVVCGAAVLTLSMGIRQSFGLFMSPVTEALNISRESFALALALQNVLWGLAQPFAGIFADRYGSARVLLAGSGCYVAGLLVMGIALIYVLETQVLLDMLSQELEGQALLDLARA